MTGVVASLLNAAADAMRSQVGSGMLVLSLVGGLLAFCRNLPLRLVSLLKRRCIVQVDVVGGDPLFREVLGWLDAHPYSRRSRLLTASSGPNNRSALFSEKHSSSMPPPILFTPAAGEHLIWHNGRPLWLSRDRKEVQGQEGDFHGYRETLVLRMFGQSAAPVRALLEEARELAVARAHKTGVYVPVYGSWERVHESPPRALSSVILPAGVMEDMVRDAEGFLRARDWYARRGIPWRRGYLLEGAPGTGKTSAIGALAGHLGADLYVCSITDRGLTDDRLLASLLGVPEGSIVLLEDVDGVVQGREMQAESGVTFAGLLNALDGVASRGGVLTFMTTNHAEKLDPALIRDGRVDHRITFGPSTHEQATRLFAHFYERPVDDLADAFAATHAGRSMAEVQGVLLRHRDDPVAAARHANERSVSFLEVVPVDRAAPNGRSVTPAELVA